MILRNGKLMSIDVAEGASSRSSSKESASGMEVSRKLSAYLRANGMMEGPRDRQAAHKARMERENGKCP